MSACLRDRDGIHPRRQGCATDRRKQPGNPRAPSQGMKGSHGREGCGWEGVLFTGRGQRPQECTGSQHLPGTCAPPGTHLLEDCHCHCSFLGVGRSPFPLQGPALPPSFFLLLDPPSEGGRNHCYGKSGKGREFTGRSHQRTQSPALLYLRQTQRGDGTCPRAHGWAGSRPNPRALGTHLPALCLQSSDRATHHSNRHTWGLMCVCLFSHV